jgi:ABC-type transport system involved in multi-copper enzyme maturation permease subunit
MFQTLFLKEIQESITTLRFFIAALICLFLLPLGMYVSLKDYEQRFADYEDAQRLYLEQSKGRVGGQFEAEGYRPPPVLSIFAIGLENHFPKKFMTTANGLFKIENEPAFDNLLPFLFGKMDYLYNVAFVLSLLSLVFTFNLVSGEKEKATLRLILANPVARSQIVLAKLFGNYLVFLISFLPGLIVGLLVINLFGSVPLFSGQYLPVLLLFIMLSLLFLFIMFNLGILISASTHRSVTSIITLLLIWVTFTLLIPKISPVIARALYPVRSPEIFQQEFKAVEASLEKEIGERRKQLLEKVMGQYHLNPGSPEDNAKPEMQKALDQYNSEREPMETGFRERHNNELTAFSAAYENERQKQWDIAMNMARFSPMSSLQFLMADLAGTGVGELKNFNDNAVRFQNQVSDKIYQHLTCKRILWDGWQFDFLVPAASGSVDWEKMEVPRLTDYHYLSLAEVIRKRWFDIFLLLFWGILFLVMSYVSFLKYDVR